jgi:hypothetical protein
MGAPGVSAVRASCKISVRSKYQHGEDRCVSSDETTFSGSSGNWGQHQLIPLDQLRPASSPYLSSDRLLLTVNLTVLNTVADG